MAVIIVLALVCLAVSGWITKMVYDQQEDGAAAAAAFAVGFIVSACVVAVGGPWLAAMTTGVVPGYSDGDRVGYVTKMSHKGYVWKTWEGQIQVGQGSQVATQDPFEFSVVEERIKSELETALTSGKKVKIHYRQWLVMPYKKGSSSYEITSVEILNEPMPAEKK